MRHEDKLVKQLAGINFSMATIVAVLLKGDGESLEAFTKEYVKIMEKYDDSK